ncbi:MAG: phosphoribosyltransferase family protein [Candidatus Helarchaeota archaeon]
MSKKYKDREDAGRILAREISYMAKKRNIDINQDNAVILAIPDEGVIPAYVVANELNLKINLIVVGKLKLPNSDIGFGSITIDGTTVLNDAMINKYRLREDKISKIEKEVIDKMVNKIELYEIPLINLELLKDKYVIIVDEGAETGYSMIGAIKSINLITEPKIIIVAIPTSSFHAIMVINRYTPHIVCPNIVDSFFFQVRNSYNEYYKLDNEIVLKYIDKIKEKNILFS